MEECKNLDYVIKDNDLNKLFNWMTSECNCIICEKYNLILKIFEEDLENNNILCYGDFLDNENFKKIKLTENMREKINNEISNKIFIKKIFKIIKD